MSGSDEDDSDDIFPADLNSFRGSAFHAKCLLAMVVSTVCYERRLFPKECFEEKSYAGVKVRVLTRQAKGACKIVDLTKACYDAIDKQYLRKVLIAVCKNHFQPEMLTESYTISVCYPDTVDGNGSTASQVKESVLRMLESVTALCLNLQPLLGPTVGVTMKLFYYDHRTPKSYQPVGFRNLIDEDDFVYCGAEGPRRPTALSLGKVRTNFHVLEVRHTSASGSDGGSSQPPDLDDLENEAATFCKIQPVNPATVRRYKPPVIQLARTCKCLCDRDTIESDMLMCFGCLTFQHAVCYGQPPDGKRFLNQTVCFDCARDNPQRQGHDGTLPLLRSDAKFHCLYRQTLHFLLKQKATTSKLAITKYLQINQDQWSVLCARLMREQCIEVVASKMIHVNHAQALFLANLHSQQGKGSTALLTF